MLPAIAKRPVIVWIMLVSACLCSGCRSRPRAVAPLALSTPEGTRVGNRPPASPPLGPRLIDPGDPAGFCPPDTRVYLRANDLSSWGKRAEDASLVAHVRWLIETVCPPSVWQVAKDRLGTDGRGLFDRYFGHTVAVVSPGRPRDSGLVVISRADPAALRMAARLFELKPVDVHPSRGSFRFYSLRSEGGDLSVAIGGEWFLLSAAARSAGLEQLAERMSGPPRDGGLANTAAFRELSTYLPDPRMGLLFVRDARGAGRHEAVATRDGRDLVVHYAGTDPVSEARRAGAGRTGTRTYTHRSGRGIRVDAGYPHLSRFAGMDFGILPGNTVAAASMNLIHRYPKDLGVLDLPVLFSNVRQRIIPGIDPPALAFVGDVALEQGAGRPAVHAPAVGVAVRLGIPGVARDLDGLIRTLHFLVTLTSWEVGKALFGVDGKKEGATPFQVAEFGDTLIRHIKDPALAALANLPAPAGLRRIAFGRIGEWYVVCSQEAFFRQCVRAASDSTLRLAASAPFGAFGVGPRPNLLFTAFTQTAGLRSLLDSLTAQLAAETRKEKGAEKPKEQPVTGREGKLANTPPAAPPFARLEEAFDQLERAFRTASKHWCAAHTAPDAPVAPKAKRRSFDARSREKERPPPRTDPRRALEPMRWIA